VDFGAKSLPVNFGANLCNLLVLLCLGPIKRCAVLRICAAGGLGETHAQQAHELDGLFQSRLNCRFMSTSRLRCGAQQEQ
jgi:hypothetical protein